MASMDGGGNGERGVIDFRRSGVEVFEEDEARRRKGEAESGAFGLMNSKGLMVGLAELKDRANKVMWNFCYIFRCYALLHLSVIHCLAKLCGGMF